MDQVVTLLGETSDEGHNLIVVANDAYFGLFYGAEVAPALVFARLTGIHPRLLVVKVDGPMKGSSGGGEGRWADIEGVVWWCLLRKPKPQVE
jgi:hypothetical protein